MADRLRREIVLDIENSGFSQNQDFDMWTGKKDYSSYAVLRAWKQILFNTWVSQECYSLPLIQHLELTKVWPYSQCSLMLIDLTHMASTHTHSTSLLLKVNSLDVSAYCLGHNTHKVSHNRCSTGELKK